ncbi:RagB/SusD family nutrient uptake outer membrane protein [Segatella copri]|uniref:RagB/SusD family nutrient uptake outer membrane protein n=1 Tax=Segatella copri TaxID=165179 RepID=UPI002FF021A9
MKTNKFLLLAMATASLGLSSCDDGDFLTEKPKTIYTTGNAYGTVDQVKANITNLYIHIRYWYQNDKFLKGQGTDVLDTPYFRDTNGGFCNFSTWSSTASSSSKIYDAMYQLVNYANQSLEGYNTPSLTWNSETEKKETYGEIMFFRGYGYLSLGEMFGGVPLVDKFYETLKLDFARSSREETYEFAIKDLEAAAESLPDYPSEAGRVSKGIAYHFLSEAYLALATIKDNDKSDLQKSVDYADKVMALHPLMTQRFGTRATPGAGTVKNGVNAYYADGNVFFDLFQEGNYDYCEGNTEALWTLENDYAVFHQYGGNNCVSTPREMCPVLRDVVWKSEYKEEGAGSGPWTGDIDNAEYPGGNVCAYLGGRAIAAIAPTNYVISEVWQNDEGDIRNAACNIRRTFKCLDKKHSMYGKEVPMNMLDFSTQKITEMFPIWTKFAPVDDWGYDDLADGGNRSNMYCDQYAHRSAETLLLRAEAKLRMGDKAGAAADVNILRDRAHCQVKAEASDMSLQYILDERVRELFGEERRWATVLRMGDDGIKSINEHAMYIADQPYWGGYFKASQPAVSKWNLFPIPQTVIDNNTGNKIEQNPGW